MVKKKTNEITGKDALDALKQLSEMFDQKAENIQKDGYFEDKSPEEAAQSYLKEFKQDFLKGKITLAESFTDDGGEIAGIAIFNHGLEYLRNVVDSVVTVGPQVKARELVVRLADWLYDYEEIMQLAKVSFERNKGATREQLKKDALEDLANRRAEFMEYSLRSLELVIELLEEQGTQTEFIAELKARYKFVADRRAADLELQKQENWNG